MWRFLVQNLRNHDKQLYKIDEVPEYQRFNPYIRTGYRSSQTYLQCLKSLLYFHNETMNIWTHVLGFLAFGTLLAWDMYAPPSKVSWEDFAVILCIITCYQACMILSAVYHTFTAHSKQVSDTCLCLDLAGIAASITASYVSGIYYAFFCSPDWRNFYLVTVGIIITLGLLFRNILKNDKYVKIRLVYFVLWALYGTVPALHWVYLSGGFGDEIVRIFLPRIVIMYAISGLAFLFYIGKIPERFGPGKFDYLGSSHQWWHVLIFLCLAYWHNTGFTFAEFRLENQCAPSIDPALKQRILEKFWINF
ncbi:progestin and adipoQ receptor family member 3 [Eurytemora carolleeae]|uniref:progestin and adipoQ receptor family member 3 n=1 Tax=Eurytemora carolleeae TaxID=1294199 RepID=UPI000C76F985|nr:progestin and adipoQ receptor family member 3 [Eurytemora carolleeae]|eukprot:XP_023348067.1 progestin and adipoQ receptor family member 3-like [Eurytemora affinis]